MNKFYFIVFLIPVLSFQKVSADRDKIDFYAMTDSEIITTISKSTDLLPDEYYRLGLAYKNTGNTNEAFSSFILSAFTKNITYVDSYTYFKKISFRSQHYNAALSQTMEYLYSNYKYDEVIKLFSLLSKDDPVLYFNAALIVSNCYSSLNEFRKAADVLSSVKNICIKSSSFEKLRKLRLGGIYEKMHNPIAAFHLYFSVIITENPSWEGEIAVKNIYRLFQNNQLKLKNNEKYVIAAHLNSINMFKESQSIISEESDVKFQILKIRNLCRLNRINDAKKIILSNKKSLNIINDAFGESLWMNSRKNEAVKFSESNELYKTNITILKNLLNFYSTRDLEKTQTYLNILETNFKPEPENDKFYWAAAKEYIKKNDFLKALKILKIQISLYKGGSYYGNAAYWINKIENNVNPEYYLKLMILYRPDSVYVFKLMDKISGNFNISECKNNFETAVAEKDYDNMIYYHFILFCINKETDSYNHRIHDLNSDKKNLYNNFNKYMNSSISKNFVKYSRILENYYNSGDFSNITALENYLSYNDEYRKLSAKVIFRLYSRNSFYYQKYFYVSRLLKLFNLNENLSILNQEIVESLYPLAFYDLIKLNSSRKNLDPLLILSLIRAESAFKPTAQSPSNAKGLMQIMDRTAGELSVKTGVHDYNIFSPQDNINFGTYYINWLNDYFSGNITLTIGAYNAGPGNMKKWQKLYDITDEDSFIEKIPFIETRNYILKIQKYRSVYEKIY